MTAGRRPTVLDVLRELAAEFARRAAGAEGIGPEHPDYRRGAHDAYAAAARLTANLATAIRDAAVEKALKAAGRTP